MRFHTRTRQIFAGGIAAGWALLAPVGSITANAAPEPEPGSCSVAEETKGSRAIVCAPDVRGAHDSWPNPEDLAGDN